MAGSRSRFWLHLQKVWNYYYIFMMPKHVKCYLKNSLWTNLFCSLFMDETQHAEHDDQLWQTQKTRRRITKEKRSKHRQNEMKIKEWKWWYSAETRDPLELLCSEVSTWTTNWTGLITQMRSAETLRGGCSSWGGPVCSVRKKLPKFFFFFFFH